ncbi:MAG: STAS domain-containing protein [candidate division Zixibacteria bacterium]|nr:STAS domain-containing protein [candidate division Zixibacteria bacterium]
MEKTTITKRNIADDVIALCPGKTLDNSNAHDMVDAIVRAEQSGYRFIVVDMAGLEFLSSAGVGSILSTVELLREKGGDIVLCNVPTSVFHVLEVLDLSEYLTIRTTEEDAVAACNG